MLRLRKIYAATDCPLYGEGYPIDECKLCEYFSGIDKATNSVICAFDEEGDKNERI